jgi:hypothetical protein
LRSRSALGAGEVDGAHHVLAAAEVGRIVGQSLHEHCQIVVVAQGLGEIVEGVDDRFERTGCGRFDQPQLVPEVLDRLAPLVQSLVGRSFACAPQRRPAAPVGGLDPSAE